MSSYVDKIKGTCLFSFSLWPEIKTHGRYVITASALGHDPHLSRGRTWVKYLIYTRCFLFILTIICVKKVRAILKLGFATTEMKLTAMRQSGPVRDSRI